MTRFRAHAFQFRMGLATPATSQTGPPGDPIRLLEHKGAEDACRPKRFLAAPYFGLRPLPFGEDARAQHHVHGPGEPANRRGKAGPRNG